MTLPRLPMNSSNSGVDLDLGNHCSRTAFGWAQKTFCNRDGQDGEIRPMGSAFCQVLRMGKLGIGISSDGIGTKAEIAERMGQYDTLGYDLVAMVADDLAANGVEPTSLSNILDVDRLDASVVDALMKGLHFAAKIARITVTGGEIAELGSRIGGYGDGMHFNWCATGIGVLPGGREPVTGEGVNPGDSVIALRGHGLRSNGFSLARSILSRLFGDNWHNVEYSPCTNSKPESNAPDAGTFPAQKPTWGNLLLTPSTIFTPLVIDLLAAELPVTGIAHVTGGGIPDNLGRVLKLRKLGADLDNVFPPPNFLKDLQRLGEVSEEKIYRAWNMGNPLLLVVRRESAAEVLEKILEEGFEARLAGTVISEPHIRIRSQGAFSNMLTYEKTAK
ncbi:MAG: AIR synthase-related protein [Candidatus Ozemobacteraceae bacterium]